MTLYELYEAIDALMEEVGEDVEVLLYNPITTDYDTPAVSFTEMAESDENDTPITGVIPYIVIHPDTVDMESEEAPGELSDEPEDD